MFLLYFCVFVVIGDDNNLNLFSRFETCKKGEVPGRQPAHVGGKLWIGAKTVWLFSPSTVDHVPAAVILLYVPPTTAEKCPSTTFRSPPKIALQKIGRRIFLELNGWGKKATQRQDDS